MKTKLILLAFILLESNNLNAQTTPRGNSVTSCQRAEIFSYQDKLDWGTAFAIAYPNATEQGTATTTSTYNCHSYAWNMSEGGTTCWIGCNGSTTDEDVYWTDQSYIETTEPYASKISYYADDHSARQTATQGMYISKWGNKVLMLHARDYGPADYDLDYRKYYKLNPGVTGSIAVMCNGNQRTYGINMSIPGSTFYWTRETNLFNEVSGSTGSTYEVSATSGTGDAWVKIQLTTPSGEVASSSNFYTWVGKAQVQSISGPSSASRNIMYYYYANTNHSGGTSYDWSVSPTGPYLSPSGGEVNSCGIIFYSNGSYQLLARAVNACGTSTWCPKGVYVGSKMLSGKSLSLFPNPAVDNVNVTIKEDPLLVNDVELINSEKASNEVEPITYTVRIFNNKSNLLSTLSRSGNTFNVPLTNMRDGTYIIELSDGKDRYTQQLIIKH